MIKNYISLSWAVRSVNHPRQLIVMSSTGENTYGCSRFLKSVLDGHNLSGTTKSVIQKAVRNGVMVIHNVTLSYSAQQENIDLPARHSNDSKYAMVRLSSINDAFVRLPTIMGRINRWHWCR